MKHKILLVFAFLSLFFHSCNKNNCIENSEFCDLVIDNKIDETKPIINTFLESLDYNYEEDDYSEIIVNLNKLKDWLECKSCVDSSVIICNSCVYTYPPQSELKIYFNINNNKEIILDVLSVQPLKAIRFHN